MGAVLSGGQKQRLLLARALYRQPSILFLDEATSHLDIASEHSVNEAIRALKLTRIIVAHRPETIASADRVIVIEGGKIISDAPSQTSAQILELDSALHSPAERPVAVAG
jgi:ATP-binding cassette subfamily B protein RaxB